jgi:excisionase family DNA binding protein
LNEAADILNLSPMTVLRMIRSGILPAKQLCKGAPWVIRGEYLEKPDGGDRAKASRKRPPTSNPDQQILGFQ